MSAPEKDKRKPPAANASALCPVESARAIRVWKDMLNTGEKLVRAGLRREIGPSGDIDEAYRQWYAKQMEEHHLKVQRIMQRLWEAEVKNAD